jgi:ionotropic glutamate receptor
MYAFFMEAAAIEYHVERVCDLKQLGGLLDSKGYGVALPKGESLTRIAIGSYLYLIATARGLTFPVSFTSL